MTKLILSTGNIVSGGPSIIRKPGTFRSNFELTSSLRSSFSSAQQASAEDEAYSARNGSPADTGAVTAAAAAATNGDVVNGHANGTANGTAKTNGTLNGVKGVNGISSRRRPALASWTQREGKTLYIPRLEWPVAAGETTTTAPATTIATPSTADAETGSTASGSSSGGLQEEASRYDTTVKLFFLPGALPVEARAQYAEEALGLVFRELGVESVDLLVLSFPGMSFEGDCEWEADKINAKQGNDDDEAATWAAAAETLYKAGKVRRLGVAEFGSEKLARFVARVGVPAVDQINIHNCCNVPPPLMALAKDKGIELLVHTDCTDILPPGTLRELLGQGPQGAGVLVDEDGTTTSSNGSATPPPADALRGDLTPQWVVKYTAVVRDRGVIENKGYFAGALLHDE
ncbi:hypothetical protein SCUCBS95973_003852 [Sporothrix curviconia]|uniref:GCS light chain n=1 Tax=Sporothrix curviconia TaxID=1260050 RepID=A0ABP0BIV0_9PEZI